MSITNSQTLTSSSSTSSSDISDVQNAIRIKNTEYLKAIKDFSSLLEDYPEYESVHESVDSFIDHKVRMVMGLMEQVKQADPEALDIQPDLEKTVNKTQKALSEELQHLKECLKRNQAELVEAETEVNRMVKEMELLKSIAEKREVEGEMHSMENLERKYKSADRAFQKHKMFLHDAISEIFPNKKELVHDLLGDLCDKFFNGKGGDDYITIDDSADFSIIELLLEGNIIKRHPYDKTKIKFSDF